LYLWSTNTRVRLTSIEIKFFIRTLFGHKRNEEVLEELKLETIKEKIRRYKSNLLRGVTRMNNNRMAKIMLNYRPNGRRRFGRPLKRLLDEAETSLSMRNTSRTTATLHECDQTE